MVLADFNETTLDALATEFRDDGFAIRTQKVDVSSRESAQTLADAAAAIGPIMQVAHTAAVSPTQAPLDAVLRVDLVGVGLVLDVFGQVIARGGAGVVISSSSSYLANYLTPEEQAQVQVTEPEDLLSVP